MGIFAPKWAMEILYEHTLELLEHIGKFQSFFVRLKNNYIFTAYCSLHNNYLNTVIIYKSQLVQSVGFFILINNIILAL